MADGDRAMERNNGRDGTRMARGGYGSRHPMQGLAMCHLNRDMKKMMVYMGKSISSVEGTARTQALSQELLVVMIKFDP